MIIQRDTSNETVFQGRITNVKEYSKDKAANITIAVENKTKDGKTKTLNIQTKSFSPAMYNNTKTGMLVRLYGHVSPSSYEKNGKTIYTQDLITDYIEFLESKFVVDAREAAKTANKSISASDVTDDDLYC